MEDKSRFTRLVLALRGSYRAYPYAAKVGLARQTIIRWCKGDGDPSDAAIEKLLTAEKIEREDFDAYIGERISLEELLARRKDSIQEEAEMSRREERLRVGDRLNIISVRGWLDSLPVEELMCLVQEIMDLIARRWREGKSTSSIRALVRQNREAAIDELGAQKAERLMNGGKPTIYDLVRLALVIPGLSSEDLIAIARREFGELEASSNEEEKKTNGHAL